MNVAPLVGAWIEMKVSFLGGGNSEVAPLVGAWIEMKVRFLGGGNSEVAPLVGAWIEMRGDPGSMIHPLASLPSWERGLKYSLFFFYCSNPMSLPSWERGLKL